MKAQTFQDFKLNKQLWMAIEEAGYETPTPIQQKGIPRILANQDVMGIAPTGTGKTAAYLLPLLMRVKFAQGDHPRVLILGPTRELVMQIDKEIEKLAKYTDIRHVAVYGGLGPKTQIEQVKAGLDILVGTPGRVMDLYFAEALVFRNLQCMVLDEADRMLDMGFMPQIRKLLEVIPRKRQNLLFSATMSERVTRLSEEFLEFPERIEVSPQATTPDLIEQSLYDVPNFRTKINLLKHFLEQEEEVRKVMIFTRTKAHADNIFKFIERKGGGNVRVIHANKGQNTRINAMNDFKEGQIRILVATDVAARGIDVSLVTHVINFDVPILYEDYVHRVGRTGRANQTGTAITFCTPPEKYHIAKIEKLIRMSIPVVPLPEGVAVENTGFEEQQEMAREIDEQKRKDDPNFKGAFHEKKNIYSAEKSKAKSLKTSTKSSSFKMGGPAKKGGKFSPFGKPKGAPSGKTGGRKKR